MQVEDERCCGTGTCIVDAQGRCWCGQQWDGMSMCLPAAGNSHTTQALDSGRAGQEVFRVTDELAYTDSKRKAV